MIDTLIAAIEASDRETAIAQFAPGATIHDEGRDWAPAEWVDHVFAYGLAIEVLRRTAGAVTVEVAGEFPGSPLEFTWHGEDDGERITALRI